MYTRVAIMQAPKSLYKFHLQSYVERYLYKVLVSLESCSSFSDPLSSQKSTHASIALPYYGNTKVL